MVGNDAETQDWALEEKYEVELLGVSNSTSKIIV